jgi:hypothetical protein
LIGWLRLVGVASGVFAGRHGVLVACRFSWGSS